MQALITGANGFIGSHLSDALIEKGIRVRAMIRKGSDTSFLDLQRVEICYGDIRNTGDLEKAIFGAEYVYHCAAIQKRTSWENYYNVNVKGTENLLKACLSNRKNIKKVILLSSLAAVGPARNGEFLKEDSECRPINLYSKSKFEAEKIAEKYIDKLPVTIVRPPMVYGSRNKDMFCSYGFIKRIHNLHIKLLLGHRDTQFSFIHVKDLARFLVEVAEADISSGEVFFSANNMSTTWDEIGEVCSNILGTRTVEIYLPLLLLKAAVKSAEAVGKITLTRPLLSMQGVYKRQFKNWACDVSKAKRALDFECTLSLREGLEETISWYKDNKWL